MCGLISQIPDSNGIIIRSWNETDTTMHKDADNFPPHDWLECLNGLNTENPNKNTRLFSLCFEVYWSL